MGLFDSLKKSKVDNAYISFLTKADAAYTKAYQIKNASNLEQFCTRGCLVKQVERVHSGEKAYSGLERYKHVVWELVGETVSNISYKKVVTYDQIKMSQGIVAPVGDAYEEVWVIDIANGPMKISEIRRLA